MQEITQMSDRSKYIRINIALFLQRYCKISLL